MCARLSNETGSTALRIGAAHIGLRSSGANLVAGSDRDLSFGGRSVATIPPGAPLVSDPVDLAVPSLADLAISVCLPTDYATAPIAGHDCLERFDRDVLATTGAGWLFALIGSNDIVYSPSANTIPADELIAGYLQLIARARQRANDWIRNGGAWDAVAGFDQALRDPVQTTRPNPAYDSGDRLHPNDAGHQIMAQAIPLNIFTAA